MIKNVIFDLDGTLLDTSAGIIESIQYTVDKMGSSSLSHEQMLSFIGPSLQRSFADVCGYDEKVPGFSMRDLPLDDNAAKEVIINQYKEQN